MLINLLSRGDFWDLSGKFSFDCEKIITAIQDKTWIQYNPHKSIKRYGIPLTVNNRHSPDSYEYNGLTSLRELLFKAAVGVDIEGQYDTFTDLAKDISFDVWWNSIFKSTPSRCHFIKLDAGGHFPPHRDGNYTIDTNDDCFRLFVPIKNCNKRQFVWLQNGRQLEFEHGRAYFINTYVEHSVYSFTDDCVFMVINVHNKHAKELMEAMAIR